MTRHDLDVLNKRNRMTAEERRADIVRETFPRFEHQFARYCAEPAEKALPDQEADMPFNSDLDNVAREDWPWPEAASLCDDMPRDPLAELGSDAE